MHREIALPPQFAELTGLIDYVTRVGSNELASTCPACRGEIHPDGSYPDRFRLFFASKATGSPLGFCRRCGYVWFPGKGKGKDWKPDKS